MASLQRRISLVQPTRRLPPIRMTEIMAFDGIMDCFQRDDHWFCGVVVTNGSGSPRDGLYRHYTDGELQVVRRKEQRKAAVIGEYAAQILLDYPSTAVKDAATVGPVNDLVWP
jgi:hypothetical protein